MGSEVYFCLEMKIAFEGASHRDMCHTQSVRQAGTSGPNVASSLATPFGMQCAVRAEPCIDIIIVLFNSADISCLDFLAWCSMFVLWGKPVLQEVKLGTSLLQLLLADREADKDFYVGCLDPRMAMQLHWHTMVKSINGGITALVHSKAAQVMRAHSGELQVGFRRVKANGKMPLRNTFFALGLIAAKALPGENLQVHNCESWPLFEPQCVHCSSNILRFCRPERCSFL